MLTHTYSRGLHYATVESTDWICKSGHCIHMALRTIFYDQICWC
jgi:hypothetical protein